ncbi:MAG: LapA family protein [Gammaproteobacteria bacterium]|nr:LapA family protein [Gammaproteobacteria bacterium]
MRYWIGLFIIALGILVGLQNPGFIKLHWFIWSLELPIAVACLVIFMSGLLIGWLLYPIQHFFRKKS